MVTTPQISAVRDADKVITVLKSYELESVSVVINRVRGDMLLSGAILSPEEIAEILKTPVLGILPEEDEVLLSEMTDKTKAFRLLALNLTTEKKKMFDVTKKYTGFVGGLRRFFRGI